MSKIQFNFQILLYFICFLLFFDIIDYILYLNSINFFGWIGNAIGVIGKLSAVYVLFRNGTLVKSKYFFPIILIGFSISFIGALFKIMHWPGANELFIIGHIFTMIVYTLHFVKKKYKNILDMLKVIWIIIAYSSSLLRIMHLEDTTYFELFGSLLLIILFAKFTQVQYLFDKKKEIAITPTAL